MEMPTQMPLPVKSCGLKMHQRSCRVIDDLENELQQQMTEALNNDSQEDNIDPVNPDISTLNIQENFSDLKRGIKLPKSPLQWSTANDFFKLAFSNHPITPDDLNNNINGNSRLQLLW